MPKGNCNGDITAALKFDVADATLQSSNAVAPGSPGYVPTYSLDVNVAAVDDSPTIGVPTRPKANGTQPLVLSSANGNALSVGDADLDVNGPAKLLVFIRVSDGEGQLSLINASGLEGAVGAPPSTSLMFSGTVAAINTALAAGLTLSPGVASITVSVTGASWQTSPPVEPRRPIRARLET